MKLRIVTFSSYDSSSGPLLQELGWDGLSIRRIKLLATEIFKVYNNMATDLCQIFLKMRSTYDTRGSFSRFQLPLPKTNSVWQKTFWPSICENRGPQKRRSVVWMNWKGQYGGFVYFYLRFLRLKTGQITIRSSSTVQDLSNLKFLSQLTISHRGQWNSTTWSVMHCWGWGSE